MLVIGRVLRLMLCGLASVAGDTEALTEALTEPAKVMVGANNTVIREDGQMHSELDNQLDANEMEFGVDAKKPVMLFGRSRSVSYNRSRTATYYPRRRYRRSRTATYYPRRRYRNSSSMKQNRRRSSMKQNRRRYYNRGSYYPRRRYHNMFPRRRYYNSGSYNSRRRSSNNGSYNSRRRYYNSGSYNSRRRYHNNGSYNSRRRYYNSGSYNSRRRYYNNGSNNSRRRYYYSGNNSSVNVVGSRRRWKGVKLMAHPSWEGTKRMAQTVWKGTKKMAQTAWKKAKRMSNRRRRQYDRRHRQYDRRHYNQPSDVYSEELLGEADKNMDSVEDGKLTWNLLMAFSMGVVVVGVVKIWKGRRGPVSDVDDEYLSM